MNVLKSCLMIVGLLAILLIGGCMMGAYSLGSALSKAVNPTELTTTVDQSPEKVRSKLYRFLKTASDEPTAKPVTVSPYSDGSVHLSYGNAEPYDLNLVITVTPKGDSTTSEAKAVWQASKFASLARDGVTEDAVNRAINKRVKTALNDIDQDREFSSSMSLSSLLDAARHDKLASGTN
ncbi:MAG: hypothetical protein RL367_1631 [Pseudomonadota bacterium]